MIDGKRAQAAGSAAVFVAIIAALLVAFIILVNPQQRAELLGEPSGSSLGSSVLPSGSLVKSLLKATPGRIDYLAQTEIEHALPISTIQTKSETKVLAQKNLAYAKNALFSEKGDQFVFTISDVANTENVVLGFSVKSMVGDLIISLNGEEVLRVAEGEKVKPVMLPHNLLQATNTLMIAVSSPGAAFWRTDEVNLENLQIVADVTTLDAQTSKNIFLISDVEKKNMEKVVLKFSPQCIFDKVGKLSIVLNSREIYNAVPDCDVGLVKLELSPDGVHSGENEMIFSTQKGMYVLSSITIVSKLREIDFPTYYFDLAEEDYQKVVGGSLKLRLAMSFVDVMASKTGDIYFNAHKISFDTKDVVFSVDANDFVVQGSNAIKISPRKSVEIRELRADLIK